MDVGRYYNNRLLPENGEARLRSVPHGAFWVKLCGFDCQCQWTMLALDHTALTRLLWLSGMAMPKHIDKESRAW